MDEITHEVVRAFATVNGLRPETVKLDARLAEYLDSMRAVDFLMELEKQYVLQTYARYPIVLRRGKGPNEPSKATLEEVASWAAFHSKARTAGKVPVHYTQKKYVRKPPGAKAGLVYIEREKALMVRPVEPPKEQMADAPAPDERPGGDE